MYEKLILAAALSAAFAAPAFAEWNVLKKAPGPETATEHCIVVERPAAAGGEMHIAGPFHSQAAAQAAAASSPTCINQNAEHNFPRRQEGFGPGQVHPGQMHEGGGGGGHNR